MVGIGLALLLGGDKIKGRVKEAVGALTDVFSERAGAMKETQ
jgi:uncharacterized protein YjbJ (UPF0337 family)